MLFYVMLECLCIIKVMSSIHRNYAVALFKALFVEQCNSTFIVCSAPHRGRARPRAGAHVEKDENQM